MNFSSRISDLETEQENILRRITDIDTERVALVALANQIQGRILTFRELEKEPPAHEPLRTSGEAQASS